MTNVELMQNKIKEVHQIMHKVKEYMDEHTFKGGENIEIDYNDPDQEFFTRFFTEVEQAASLLDIFMDYIVRPVKAEGELQFDYSQGMYKLNDEYIQPEQPVEYMTNGLWHVGVFKKDTSNPMSYYIVDMKEKKYEKELKGLKVRLR